MRTLSESHVDVLIVGAGPSGLMAAAWLAQYGVKFRIIDKRSAIINTGQADGLQSRTFEIFDSFGFGRDIYHRANKMLEMATWSPDSSGAIKRTSRMIDTVQGISRFQQATLHQGHIEEAFQKLLATHNFAVERNFTPVSLKVNEIDTESDGEYPISIQLCKIAENRDTGPSKNEVPNGLFRSNLMPEPPTSENCFDSVENVKAKYVIGCDGAHSWVRKQIGISLQGEQTDYIWGVIDIIPITDFPDIRQRCSIHSANCGSMMIIPREHGIVRVYCQLKAIRQGDEVTRKSITPDQILDRAQQILHPYTLSYRTCHWYTAYQIGQRVASKFSYKERIFLAGDAVHTHSPKAGQGMNVSMQDSYNLGWKIGSVVKGICKPSILSTYEAERHQVATDLIDFDHKFSRLFSGRPANNENDVSGINMSDFRAAYANGNMFTSGVAVQYGPSLLVAGCSEGTIKNKLPLSPLSRVVAKQHLARKVPLGRRLESHQILNQADARPLELQELWKSDGRWRLLVFAGDITGSQQKQRVAGLGLRLADTSWVSHSRSIVKSPVDVLTIHSAPRVEVDIFDLPEALRPFDPELGWDYWKIHVDDESHHQGHGQAYQHYGISPQNGCLVLVRPDQHVSYIGDLEDMDEVHTFFGGFM